MANKSFLDELSGPFVPSPLLETNVKSIRTELPNLLKATFELLTKYEMEILIDFSLRMNVRKSKKLYKSRHPDEHKRFHCTPAERQIRNLRLAVRLLEGHEEILKL